MKILSNYFIGVSFICLITLAQSTLSEETNLPSSHSEVGVKENSNPGFSYKNPILVTKAKNDLELLEFQQEFMKKWSEDYIIGSQMLRMTLNDRLLQIFSVSNENGDLVVMYFDITEVAKKHRKFLNKEFKEEVKNALKKGCFKRPDPKDVKEEIPWVQTSENVRQLIWDHMRQKIKKGTLTDKTREEIKKGVPEADIPADIRKEFFGNR